MNVNYRSYLVPSIEVIAKLFAFANTLIIIRVLDQYEYGIYNYVVSFGLLLSVFMDGGLNYYAFNSSIKDEKTEVSTIFKTKIVVSILVIIVSYILLRQLDFSHSFLILIFSVNLLFSSSIAFLKVVARGQNVISVDIYGILSEPIIRLIFLSLVIFFIGYIITLPELFLAFSIIGFLALIIIMISINKKIDLIHQTQFKVAKSWLILKNARPYLFYYFSIVAIQRVDIFFINNNLGAETLGFFSASYNLYLILQLFVVSLIMTRFKKAAYVKGEVQKLLIELFIIVIVIISIGSIISKDAFQIIYPESYHDSYLLFNYLLWGLPFFILTTLAIYLNNYRNLSNLNSTILFSLLILKVLVLTFYKFQSLDEYVYLLVLVEVIMGIVFTIKSGLFKWSPIK